MLEPGKGILAHRERGGKIHTWVMLSRPQDWFADIDFTDPAAATARIVREFDGWAPELTALVTDGETLCDGAELGQAIAAHPDDIETALTGHEQAMFARSAAADAPDLHVMLGDDTPHDLINAFT